MAYFVLRNLCLCLLGAGALSSVGAAELAAEVGVAADHALLDGRASAQYNYVCGQTSKVDDASCAACFAYGTAMTQWANVQVRALGFKTAKEVQASSPLQYSTIENEWDMTFKQAGESGARQSWFRPFCERVMPSRGGLGLQKSSIDLCMEALQKLPAENWIFNRLVFQQADVSEALLNDVCTEVRVDHTKRKFKGACNCQKSSWEKIHHHTSELTQDLSNIIATTRNAKLDAERKETYQPICRHSSGDLDIQCGSCFHYTAAMTSWMSWEYNVAAAPRVYFATLWFQSAMAGDFRTFCKEVVPAGGWNGKLAREHCAAFLAGFLDEQHSALEVGVAGDTPMLAKLSLAQIAQHGSPGNPQLQSALDKLFQTLKQDGLDARMNAACSSLLSGAKGKCNCHLDELPKLQHHLESSGGEGGDRWSRAVSRQTRFSLTVKKQGVAPSAIPANALVALSRKRLSARSRGATQIAPVSALPDYRPVCGLRQNSDADARCATCFAYSTAMLEYGREQLGQGAAPLAAEWLKSFGEGVLPVEWFVSFCNAVIPASRVPTSPAALGFSRTSAELCSAWLEQSTMLEEDFIYNLFNSVLTKPDNSKQIQADLNHLCTDVRLHEFQEQGKGAQCNCDVDSWPKMLKFVPYWSSTTLRAGTERDARVSTMQQARRVPSAGNQDLDYYPVCGHTTQDGKLKDAYCSACFATGSAVLYKTEPAALKLVNDTKQSRGFTSFCDQAMKKGEPLRWPSRTPYTSPAELCEWAVESKNLNKAVFGDLFLEQISQKDKLSEPYSFARLNQVCSANSKTAAAGNLQNANCQCGEGWPELRSMFRLPALRVNLRSQGAAMNSWLLATEYGEVTDPTKLHNAGIAANKKGETMTAYALFVKAVELRSKAGKDRAPMLLSAGNMALKLGDAATAESWYMRAEKLRLTTEQRAMAARKLAEARAASSLSEEGMRAMASASEGRDNAQAELDAAELLSRKLAERIARARASAEADAAKAARAAEAQAARAAAEAALAAEEAARAAEKAARAEAAEAALARESGAGRAVRKSEGDQPRYDDVRSFWQKQAASLPRADSAPARLPGGTPKQQRTEDRARRKQRTVRAALEGFAEGAVGAKVKEFERRGG